MLLSSYVFPQTITNLQAALSEKKIRREQSNLRLVFLLLPQQFQHCLLPHQGLACHLPPQVRKTHSFSTRTIFPQTFIKIQLMSL